MIFLAFFDGDGDVCGFAVLVTDDGKGSQALPIYIDSRQDGILDHHFEVPGALIEIADTGFQILV